MGGWGVHVGAAHALSLSNLVHSILHCPLDTHAPPPPPLVLHSAGGAGGRYTWGKLGEIYDDDGRAKDSKDPNYDSAEETVGACHLR